LTAADPTQRVVSWWERNGVLQVDVAVRRPTGVMMCHEGLALGELPERWARAENVRRADVYARPARGRSWPVVFLDDLPEDLSRDVARK
jgi:hypothetical protein